MELQEYERPREKLRMRGASFLTTVELVQIIVGSGSAKVSGARLAKRVVQALESSDISFQHLLQIDGIGMAKACQVLAALELGRRASDTSRAFVSSSIASLRVRQLVARHRKTVIGVYFFDGSNLEVAERHYGFARSSTVRLTVQHIAEDALSLAARSIVVGMGSKNESLQTSVGELDLVKQLRESLQLLSVRINEVYKANAKAVERWSDI